MFETHFYEIGKKNFFVNVNKNVCPSAQPFFVQTM